MLHYHVVNQMLSSQDRARGGAHRRSPSSQGVKRIFRLSNDRVAAREIGRR